MELTYYRREPVSNLCEARGARRGTRGAKREALTAYRLALTLFPLPSPVPSVSSAKSVVGSQHNGRIFRYLTCEKNRGALRAAGYGVAIDFVPILCVMKDLTAEHFEGVVGERVLNQDPFAAELRSHLFDCHPLFHCEVNLAALT